MESKQDLVQTLTNIQRKYKGFKEGNIKLLDDEVSYIKCPKTFKYDSFIELDCENK